MPIHVVGARNQRVHIPVHALAVSISGAVANAQLEILAAPDQPVVRVSGHEAMLPKLLGQVHVAVRPIGIQRFDAGSVIHLSIGHDNPNDADPVVVQFDPVDVSGDSEVVFAVVTLQGPRIEVGVNAVADLPLSPLGSAARNAARRVVQRGAAPKAPKIVVALDSSASMRSWYADGSAAAATDIIVGVAAAVGLSDVSAVVVGSDVAPVQVAAPGAPGALADAVRQLQPRWTAGARWSRLTPGQFTLVCSDSPTESLRRRFPVMSLSNDVRLSRLGARLPGPRPGEDAAAEVLAHPDVLDQIAASLVRVLT